MVPPFAPPHEGGSERFCMNLSKRLIEKGHEVAIYTSRYPNNTPVTDVREGVRVVRFRCWSYLMQVNPLSFFMQAVDRNLWRWDLVHVHSYIFFYANQLALLRKVKRFPFILHLHGGLGYIPPSLMGVKASAMKIFYDRGIGPLTIQAADRVIACCETDRNMAISLFGADPSRIFTVPNCVDASNFHVCDQHNPINVTYIGRLTKLKGCHQLPYIVKNITRKHRNVRFTVVGSGPLLASLMQSLKNEPVTFTGAVPNSMVPSILGRSQVLILPSFLEGFPLVILEAHASGVPVVCYDVGGCWEAVNDSTGALIPVGDVGRFTEALSGMISDEKARVNMGEVGRLNVLRKYDWPVAIRSILKVYDNVL